jgi:glutamate racemase
VLGGLFDRPGGAQIDVIVNACTHFPLVEAELAAAAPAGVRFVDGGPGIARRIAFLTEGQGWPAGEPVHRAVFTRLGEGERALAPALAGYGIGTIEGL